MVLAWLPVGWIGRIGSLYLNGCFSEWNNFAIFELFSHQSERKNKVLEADADADADTDVDVDVEWVILEKKF